MTRLEKVRRFLTSEDAATSVEYAVMLALILAVLMIGLTSAGGGVKAWWERNDSELQAHGF
ncbi:MAG: Flp family type IVb pilin [Planctomycetaceae bacterium]